MFYIVIGIVLLLLSAGTIAVMVLFEIRDRRAGNIQQVIGEKMLSEIL